MNTRVKRTFLDDWFDEGYAVGLAEGRTKMLRKLVTQQLEHRVGTLGVTWQSRLKRFSLKQLEQLGLALLEFTSPRDLSAWMKEHAGGRLT